MAIPFLNTTSFSADVTVATTLTVGTTGTFGGNVNTGRLFVEQSGADMIDMTRTGVGTYRFAISSSDGFSLFDVGANVGDTLVEFKEWWPSSEVHCFEPQEECWPELESKVLHNNYKDVSINKHAVGDVEKDAEFYSHEITSGQSGLHKINSDSLDSINLLSKLGPR